MKASRLKWLITSWANGISFYDQDGWLTALTVILNGEKVVDDVTLKTIGSQAADLPG